jgi:PAS domain S-box-containing protein
MTLPLASTDAPDPQDERCPAGSTHPAASCHDELINILLVDDEPRNLTVLETVLADPGYRLVRAESAEEALLALVVEEFALLVLDIQMPGMSGFELAQMIKQRKKTAGVPIIFLTAYYSEDQYVLEGYGSGAVDYLHKPINPAILRSKVAVFAELHRKSRESARTNHALLDEVTARRLAQEQLRQLNDELERRVADRTAELVQANAALSESERWLRVATDAAALGTWEYDHDTGFGRWSDRVRVLLGVGADQRASLEVMLDRVHRDDRSTVLAAIERSTDPAGDGTYAVEFRVVLPDGTVHWLEESGETVFKTVNGRREPAHRSGVVRNVTDRKRTEEALRHSEEALKNADRRKDEFLATLAHELRNPLAPIRTGLHVLKLSRDAAVAADTREMMSRQLSHMVRLIDDLLEVSRITSDKVTLRKERVALQAVVETAVEASRPVIETAGHALTLALPEEPVWLAADPTRLAQVVGNLLTNAAKYTPERGCIEVAATRESQDVSIRVTDTGLGIPPEMLAKVFEMFAQVNRTLDRSQGGLGIGLALVKRLVELHGGTITAESPGLGKGSTFTVRLPLAAADAGPAEPTTTAEDKSARPLMSGCRVLVVDDNVDGAECLAAMLRISGYETRTAHSGPEALDAAQPFQPEVVFLDIGLPGMNGYEVAKRMRGEPSLSGAVLVALTGWGSESDKQQSRQAGFDFHLTKPVEVTAIKTILARVAGGGGVR